MSKPRPKSQPLSLAAFAHNRKVEERRRTCAVCRLPEEVRAQVRQARERKVDRQTVGAWLGTLGYKIDDLDWQSHNAGLHDQRAAGRPT